MERFQIHERHGREGQTTEYYEFDIPSPKFVTQRSGEAWIVGVIHIDRLWWFDNILYPTAAAGRAQARRYCATYLAMGTLPDDPPGAAAENPYDHDSGYSGCAADCRACVWDRDYPKTVSL